VAKGSELLIVDNAPRDREGLRKFFDDRGFVCTAAGDIASARKLVQQKFFPAAVIDLDVDQPNAGLDLARYIREHSRHTAIVFLTSRKSYEAAVEALRIGVIDIVRKTPDQVDYLAELVSVAAERYHQEEGDELYREVRTVLDESFKVMLGLSRKVYSHLSLAAAPLRPRVMIVDGDPAFLQELSKIIRGGEWEITGEMSGGAALDRGMNERIDIVAARNELPDLRGSMVLRSIQAQRSEVIGILYSAVDGGRIDRIEQGQTLGETDRPFRGAAHLVEKIRELADELGTRATERRFIQAFRSDHEAFLRRFAELKLKIDRLISD
jgi:DNA-binding response OmpR family regulator